MWELFHAALEQSPDARADWLTTQCADDTALRDELAGLLAAHAAGDSPLDRAPAAALVEPSLPESFGPWQVRREIGRGGMGRVLEVERTDGEYAQRAALKLIDPLFAHGSAVERFLRERQILARLNHPRIARLLDGGRSAEGQPWLVMEYIDGQPIDRWCAAHDASTAQKVALLIDICEAVDFAHRQLVVHRDLKPGNVLVTPDGVPMLLDFGIARSLDPLAAAATAVDEARPLTPRYASPEQLCGEPVGVACDVYALGVLAFELFAGEPPYEVAGLGWMALAERLRSGDPAALHTTPRGRTLPRELDWICAKAMQPDPARRYPTAQALADDLRAALAHRPVAARGPGSAYRIGKFLRRRWPWVAVGAVFALTVAGFMLRVAGESAATRAALAASEVERERAQSVARFLSELFRSADTTQSDGVAISARDVLDRGRARLAASADLPPPARVLLLNSLAEVYRNMGEYAEAGVLLEQARDLLAQVGSTALEAQTLENLGVALELAGRPADARAPLEHALALRRAIAPPDPAAVAQAAIRLAGTLQTLGERDAAGALFAEAHAIRSAVLPPSDPARADSALRHGSWFWVAGKLDEAAPRYREALAARRMQQPLDVPELARALDANAALAHAQGRYAQAIPLYEEALALRRRALGETHRLTADSLSNLGACRFDGGDPAGAEEPLRTALRIYASALPPDSVVPAKTHNNLGLVLQARGELDGARAQFELALSLNRRAYGLRHPRVAGNLNNLALVLERQDELAAAESALREAAAIISEGPGATHASLGFPLTNLGRLALWSGDAQAARALLEQALAVRRAALPQGHAQIADTLSWLGAAQCATGDITAAKASLSLAEEIRRIAGDDDALEDLRAIGTVCRAGDGNPEFVADLHAWRTRRGPDDRLVRWVDARRPTLSSTH